MTTVELSFEIGRQSWETTKANGSHGHWSKQYNARRDLRAYANIEARNHLNQGGHRFTGQVHCTAYIQYPTSNLADPANAAGTIKPLIDGLVDAGLLPEDHSKALIGPDYRRDAGKSPKGTHIIRLVLREVASHE
jgi:hypothetical protein